MGVPNWQLWVVHGVPICFVLLTIISDVGPAEHVQPTRTWIPEAHKLNKYDCLVIVAVGDGSPENFWFWPGVKC